ncbi:MAG: delta(1)-pyrroline-2-carboxylate reductase family protein [Burkholderiaceae bacterium]
MTAGSAPPMFDAEATERRLPWPALIDALARMMARKREGLTTSPERLALPLAGGVLLAMPATDGQYVSTKIVTVHAGNPSIGLPSVQSEVTLMRADTGQRLAVVDGQVVTARRTAAVSLLATIHLLAPRPTSALIVGAGAQARIHLQALAEGLGLRDFEIASRTPASAEGLVAFAQARGWRARCVDDLSAAVARHRLIVLATTATAAVIPDRVRDDALVVAVGAYRPQMCELPASLVHRARVVVDDLAGARHEAGDLIQAGVDWDTVTPLEHLLPRHASPADPADPADGDQTPDARDDERVLAGRVVSDRPRPTVFKSVGQALWDLAACRLIVEPR